MKRLLHRPDIAPFMGTLPPGDIQFRVIVADPDAAKKPRVATGPGFFILGDNQRLNVERTQNGHRLANKATIQFYSSDAKAKAPGKPCEISLPDGLGTYAIAWERGAGVLWIKQKGLVRSYDFTDPAEVKETTFKKPTDLEKVPKRILDVLPDVRDAPSPPPPATGVPKLTAEESRMAVLLFQGWRDGRDRLASGVFRAHGHLACAPETIANWRSPYNQPGDSPRSDRTHCPICSQPLSVRFPGSTDHRPYARFPIRSHPATLAAIGPGGSPGSIRGGQIAGWRGCPRM